MNKIIALSKIQLKEFFSKYQSGMNIKNKELGKLLIVGLIVALLMPMYQISSLLYRSFYQAGYPELTVTYMYLSTAFIAFVSSIPLVISVFFYAKDLKLLATLPISENTIIYSKLSTIYVYTLGLSALMMGPSVFFQIYYGGRLLSILTGILAILIAPIIPILAAMLMVVLMMRFFSNKGNKNMLTIVGNIILLGFIVGIQLVMVRLQMRPEVIQEMLGKEGGLLRLVGYRFPPSIWLTNMLQGSVVDTLLFIGLNVVLLLALSIISRAFYRKALQAYNVEGSRGFGKGRLYYKRQSVGHQLIKRHIKIILHNPTFFLNTFLSLFVPLLMFGISFFTGEMTMEVFRQPAMAPFITIIYSGILATPAIIGNISATVISREGKAFWETLVLPITPQQNIRFRVLSTIVINLSASLLLGAAALLIIPANPLQIFISAALCIAITLLLATADIIVNIKRPFLNWSNPTAAVKNNLNVMISLGLRVIYGGFLFLLIRILSLSMDTTVILIAAVSLVFWIVVRSMLYGRFTKEFTNIQI